MRLTKRGYWKFGIIKIRNVFHEYLLVPSIKPSRELKVFVVLVFVASLLFIYSFILFIRGIRTIRSTTFHWDSVNHLFSLYVTYSFAKDVFNHRMMAESLNWPSVEDFIKNNQQRQRNQNFRSQILQI